MKLYISMLLVVYGLWESASLLILTSVLTFCQSGELAESVAKIIDPHYADGVDMSEVQVPSYMLFGFFFFTGLYVGLL